MVTIFAFFVYLLWFSNKSLLWGDQKNQHIWWKRFGIREKKIHKTISWADHLIWQKKSKSNYVQMYIMYKMAKIEFFFLANFHFYFYFLQSGREKSCLLHIFTGGASLLWKCQNCCGFYNFLSISFLCLIEDCNAFV